MEDQSEVMTGSNKKRGSDGSIGFRVNTVPFEGGTIVQDLNSYNNEVEEHVTRWIVDTREHSIRQALISLGWTPPTTEATPAGKGGK